MDAQVTVYIPFYNRKQYLLETIDTVYNQSYQNWRMILIDDCSTDGAIDVISHYLKDERIQLISNQTNLGKSKSLNKALNMTNTPFAIELDSDDWFFPWTLEFLVNEAKKHSEDIAVFSGNIMIVEGERHRQKKQVVTGRLYKDKYDFLLGNRVVWPRFYRTSALKKVGGWPTDDHYKGNHGVDDLRVLLKLIEHFSFHWSNKLLYKVRLHDFNISNERNVCAEVKEWAVRDALKRWGDLYEPTFIIDSEGWCHVDKLIPK
ncbi:glycosyltransferase family 2 protein [Guptibacillus hwajinpoensis]|uniref:Glycosyltransferase involved in cell wall biosynthesis n=1 Tax=Guptibacillus hwajinpoensis TaxID=208199 RepID=A0ABU0K014_9BACL|nr:glycosyltransferase family 2 protein [Alkalihalobacillus hemicentroti]MDQ0482692.1 glycosyltransferase involved in cell wall biosynthesis [Alkalihalobacillus hemicentroti]